MDTMATDEHRDQSGSVFTVASSPSERREQRVEHNTLGVERVAAISRMFSRT
jgi:hypothetical protein